MPLCKDPNEFTRIFGQREIGQEKGRIVYSRMPRSNPARAVGIACPQIIRDTIEPMRSMVDGTVFDSKSDYYRHLKQNGAEIVDTPPPSAPVVRDEPVVKAEDVKDAYEKAYADLGFGAR
jgi:hypothetical protein